jgi:hypothetical protein
MKNQGLKDKNSADGPFPVITADSVDGNKRYFSIERRPIPLWTSWAVLAGMIA